MKVIRSGLTLRCPFWWEEESESHRSLPSWRTWCSSPPSGPRFSVKRWQNSSKIPLRFLPSCTCTAAVLFTHCYRCTSSGWRGHSGSLSGCLTSSGSWRRLTRRSWSQFTLTSLRWPRSSICVPPCWWEPVFYHTVCTLCWTLSKLNRDF